MGRDQGRGPRDAIPHDLQAALHGKRGHIHSIRGNACDPHPSDVHPSDEHDSHAPSEMMSPSAETSSAARGGDCLEHEADDSRSSQAEEVTALLPGGATSSTSRREDDPSAFIGHEASARGENRAVDNTSGAMHWPTSSTPSSSSGDRLPTLLMTEGAKTRDNGGTNGGGEMEPIRRRLSSKQPEERLWDTRSAWCRAAFEGGWAQRAGHRLPIAGGCSACTRPTRATCRGCRRPMCFSCLKDRMMCPRS